MTMTAWFGRPNEMEGRQFDNLAKATSFLKRKKAKIKYVEIDGFERIGKISVAAYVRIARGRLPVRACIPRGAVASAYSRPSEEQLRDSYWVALPKLAIRPVDAMDKNQLNLEIKKQFLQIAGYGED